MEAKDEEIFTVLADGETARDPARDKPGPVEPGPMEQEENQAERILYSTAQVLPPQSDPRLDWAQVGPFLLSPHGGLPWLLLVMFLGYNLWQLVRYLRMAEKPKATPGGPPTTAEVGAGMMPPQVPEAKQHRRRRLRRARKLKPVKALASWTTQQGRTGCLLSFRFRDLLKYRRRRLPRLCRRLP